MKKLILKIKAWWSTRTDKQKHFIVCCTPSLLGLGGALFALGLAIGKEYGDSKSPGNRWDNLDMRANIKGILCGLSVHTATLIAAYYMLIN